LIDLPSESKFTLSYFLPISGTITISINNSAKATYISPITFEKLVIRSANTTSLKEVSILKVGVTILFKALLYINYN